MRPNKESSKFNILIYRLRDLLKKGDKLNFKY